MDNGKILVSGAGIAGPALAYWLARYRFTATLVEKAPALREGGYGVDFRGHAHRTLLARMGITEEVGRLQTNMGDRVVVDEAGRELARLPASFMSGDVEIARGDLSRLLYERTKDIAEYVVGDSIVSVADTRYGVDVTFDRGKPRTFDLVVGADGLHSNVRGLVFGPEARFSSFLGHYIAGFSLPDNPLRLDHTGLIYNIPGKSADISSARDPAKASAGFVFASPLLDYDRDDVAQQKKIVADTYAGVGWEVPRLIDAMWDAPDLYFDAISRIDMDRWSKGRVVLLGDAGYGATVGGLGTGAAMVGAYVLAGELARAGGDHHIAFARYEERLRDYVQGCQKLANKAGPFLAPPTAAKIRRRNRVYKMLSSRLLSGLLNAMTTKAANAITLEDYSG